MLKKYKIFIILFIMISSMWLYTIISTHDNPSWDGQAVYGFPLTYKVYGGFCRNGCGEMFSYTALLIDIAFAVIVPLILQILWNLFSNKKGNKK